MKLNVSVIIPVYNAEEFLRRTVESALMQPEVLEIILVEDGSPDNALVLCEQLVLEDSRVRIIRHPGGENLGAGASRNLGILHANQDFISFLDADDFMLPNRFEKTREVFENYRDADGVYEAVGTYFETNDLKDDWLAKRKKLLTTVDYAIPPERLFLEQEPVGRCGYGHTNGWTVRKTVFDRCGLFNKDLSLHQDSDLFVRFSIVGKMYSGQIDLPVAMRRIHGDNRITRNRTPLENFCYKSKMWSSLWNWAVEYGYNSESEIILERLINHCQSLNSDGEFNGNRFMWFIKRHREAVRLCPELAKEPISYLSAKLLVRRFFGSLH